MSKPVTGHQWGVSMVAPNEAVLGAILAMAKLWGCMNVGYDIIKHPKQPHEKNPANVAAGKKGGKARAKNMGKKRKPPAQIVKAFFAKHKGARFEIKDLRKDFERVGYVAPTPLHNAINQLIADKKIKRIGTGVYVRLSKITDASAKKEAA
jgi:hypothetical protein